MKVPATKRSRRESASNGHAGWCQPTSGPLSWCSVGCHAPVTRPACWKRVTLPSLPCSPGDVQGFLYHPGLWEVPSGSAHPLSPVPPAAGNRVPSAGGASWGGVVCPCLGSISAAA